MNYEEKIEAMEELVRILNERNRELRDTIYKLKAAEKAIGSLISTVYNLKDAYKNLNILEKESGEEASS